MLQVATIKNNLDKYVNGLQKRGFKGAEELLNDVLTLDENRKRIQGELDEVLHESNKIAKEIGQLFKQGKKDEAEKAKTRTSELKQKSKTLTEELNGIETSLTKHLYNIPNIPHESVPVGNTDEDNELVKLKDKNIPNLGDHKKPHWDLIEEYDIVDFELGNKVSGAGFPFYKKQGARMVRGMINYFLDKAAEAGYEEVQPPVVINEASGLGTGQLPDKEGQMYHMEANDLYLIPTAEVPITNMYRDVILKQDELPVKHTGHTPCFRREAGSWGSHVRGLNRLHQFDKVEIVQVVEPEKSYEVLDEMVSHVENLIKSLGLPYRILRLCAGDLGFTAAITYDFEVYSAAQEKWLEVSSVSNFETYQANRLKLRIKNKEGKKELAHTLNGSALALPRIMAAILENNQTGDSIKMPEVLHPYLGFKEITRR
ncbi:seryl-tRNA synthetase [Ekhidna lutea]|uniref:Serine--tRNA ligase n=1 Tax=Ekhidna lutea TaxID=447679 RepID=A0A239KQE0_EKHLU|nr:serine--tRNA ligase [Ekhidna lutea]SNT19898.1 seryl-tRNA synthetase [Ekhidna lutea]